MSPTAPVERRLSCCSLLQLAASPLRDTGDSLPRASKAALALSLGRRPTESLALEPAAAELLLPPVLLLMQLPLLLLPLSLLLLLLLSLPSSLLESGTYLEVPVK